MNTKNLIAGAIIAPWILLIAGCGGSGSSGDDSPLAPPPPPPAPSVNHAVGGSVSGLIGELVLENNGGDALTLGADGAFKFATTLSSGSTYSVGVRTQPATQKCTMSNGSGTIADADVANIAVSCVTLTYSVGGLVYGLHPSGSLVLQMNGDDALTLGADGTFTFADALPIGSAYAVTVRHQPANQLCTVDDGNGTIADAVTNVTVNCSTITRVVGGAVSGLDPSGSVVLQNNGADDLAINANGNFAFPIPVAQSGAYDVTVLTQPATQTCSINHGSGTAGALDIADVQVVCSTNAYTVGGTLSGLSGTVQLQNNGADNLTLNSAGSFTFSAPVAQGAAYNVTVSTQPATQTCVVTNGSGTMGGANVSNVGLNCTANTTSLAASLGDLVLSVTGLTEYGLPGAASSGVARGISITNTGSHAAFNVSVSLPAFPAGTTVLANTCSGTLTAGDSCTIAISPGPTATSNGTDPCSTGTAPIPGTIEVTADNANTVSTNIVVLNYGCIYQGGYVYAFDDTGPTSLSVKGKVATTTDQATPGPGGVIWSSNGNGGAVSDVVYEVVYGISEVSTISTPNPSTGSFPGQNSCDGAVDGACNTNNILIHYSSVNTSYYAAGLCKQTISGHSDWYLPAICELGYGSPACGDVTTPAWQNMQSNLVDLDNINNLNLSTFFWSSTLSSPSPILSAWIHYFDNTGATFQFVDNKNNPSGVRCSRAF